MSGLTGNNILGGASAQTGAYDIANSLMFDQNDTPKLDRTPSSTGDRKTWTWSAWLKRSSLDDPNDWFFSSADSSERQSIAFYNDQFYFEHTNSSGSGFLLSNRYFRDVSAWYHIVVVWDTTQATDSDRVKIYINGEQLAGFTGGAGGTGGYPTLNQQGEINNTSGVYIGNLVSYSGYNYDGYMSEVNFVDGQALTPSDFAKTNLSTNQWVAKKYVGSYGTNGFYLNFDDSSSIGNDSSGNGNNFATTNLVAADVKTDTPTNNFATLNSVSPKKNEDGTSYTPTYRNGNLMSTNPPMSGESSFPIPKTGKWYAEFYITGTSGSLAAGIRNLEGLYSPSRTSDFASYRIYAYTPNTAFVGGKDINNVDTQLVNLSSYYNGGGPYEIQYAYDADNGILKYFVSGVLVATESSVDTSHQYAFFMSSTWNTAGGTWCVNFGQDSTMHGNVTGGSYTDANGYGQFKYAPPADHLALCTANIPDPAIALPKEHFDTTLVSGNGSNRSITGLNFQPDFLWGKSRTNTLNYYLTDSVRGVNSQLYSDTSGSQGSESVIYTAFNSDGFSLGTGDMNTSGQNYVNWAWKAGGTAVSNGDGSVTSSVSANPSAGFSAVTWTNNNVTVGHGLSKAPELIIMKNREAAASWLVYSEPVGNAHTLFLNTTDQQDAGSGYFNSTSPTASVFSVGTTGGTLTDDFVAYCFHSVENYSMVGLYRGNGDANGIYVYTGFKPQWLMVKQINSTRDWIMYDNKRSEFNVMDDYLHPNLNNAGTTSGGVNVDFLSNGFKWRSANTAINVASGNYIYLAFAESPFKYSNGR